MVHLTLFPIIYIPYLHISTFRKMSEVPNMVIFCTSLMSCFPSMLFGYFLNYFEMVPVILTGMPFYVFYISLALYFYSKLFTC